MRLLFPMKIRQYFQFLIIVFMILPSQISFADKAAKLNNNGIKSYNEQNLEESIEHFTEALIERPDSPEIRFNRENSAFCRG